MVKLLLYISMMLSANSFEGTWVLKHGSIDQPTDQKLIFEKFDPKVHNAFHEVYNIQKDGSITLSHHNPQNLGFCGNGMLSIHSGKWTIEGGRFRMRLEGSRLAMHSWSLDRYYEVTTDSNQLILNPIGKGTFKTQNPYVEVPIRD